MWNKGRGLNTFQMHCTCAYVRILFIDYSSAFNTIVPSKLITKFRVLGLKPSLCNWVLDFLTGRPQVVEVGNNTSAKLILNTEGPTRVCAQPPLILPVHLRLRSHTSQTPSSNLIHFICTVHSESIQTPSLYPHFVTLQPHSKVD